MAVRIQFLYLNFLRTCQRYQEAAIILFTTALALTIWSAIFLNPGRAPEGLHRSAALQLILLLGLLTLCALDAYWLFSSQAATIALIQIWGGNPAIYLGLPAICLSFSGSLAAILGALAAGFLPLRWTALALSFALGFLLAASSSLPLLLLAVFRSPTAVLRERI